MTSFPAFIIIIIQFAKATIKKYKILDAKLCYSYLK